MNKKTLAALAAPVLLIGVMALTVWQPQQPRATANAQPSQNLNPAVLNTTLTSANTEYTITVPAGASYFSLQCRSAVDVRYAFVTGKVAGSTAPYMTLKSGSALNSPEKLAVPSTGLIIYLATTDATSPVAELTYWTL